MGRIYLDANATTPVLPEVVEAMRPYWSERFGNASSVHQSGQAARSAVDDARESLATLLHCRASEVLFTSGGTESDNLALFGTLNSGDHCITTAIEHHAVLHAALELERRGIELTILQPTSQGLIEPAAAQAALRPNTKLISVMLANNETGTLQPIAEIAAIAHSVGALMHTDAVQAVGKITVDVRHLGCDLLSLSGHKMYAPQGIGVLYLRKGTPLQPLFYGGMHERERRAGTENVPGIVALGTAASIAAADLGPTCNRTEKLRNRLQQQLLRIPGTCINGGGDETERLPNTLNLRFADLDADSLVIALDLQGIEASAGSACQSGSTEPSHVLLAMGLSGEEAKSSLRLSLTHHNTAAEIETTAIAITACVDRLRSTHFVSLR